MRLEHRFDVVEQIRKGPGIVLNGKKEDGKHPIRKDIVKKMIYNHYIYGSIKQTYKINIIEQCSLNFEKEEEKNEKSEMYEKKKEKVQEELNNEQILNAEQQAEQLRQIIPKVENEKLKIEAKTTRKEKQKENINKENRKY
ncbi:hypothetical protein RFI_24867 [Reticulomyxa filosa]|uniref:Uncharacterized protein n=1 Tax=Reticulomyxa filosa TaxID=46433 RepID=X6MF50_RETFI|nr:hypothetical protein RFI_24867 [Reticulomyxa filosa]|eukprot:ETO12509.1 hypothetical protein RFI_24867 [Reticulomyxa filosa]